MSQEYQYGSSCECVWYWADWVTKVMVYTCEDHRVDWWDYNPPKMVVKHGGVSFGLNDFEKN